MGFGTQLFLLLWKNFTLRKRQRLRLVAEIVFPLALFIILVIVRTRPDLKVQDPECHFDGNAMPSAGTLPFLQSFVCNMNNTCHTKLTEDELPGMVNNFNNSQLTKLVEDVERILSNNVERELIFDLIEDWGIFESLVRMIQDGSTTGNIRVGNLLLDPQGVRNTIQNQSIGITPDALDQILNASFNIQDFGTTTFNELLQDLDVCPTGSTQTAAALQNRTVQELYDRICTQNALSQILVFSDQAAYENVKNQLCNLTVGQFFEFLEDFRNQTDLQQIENEVIQFVSQNTGSEPNLRPSELIPLFITLSSEFQALRSVNIQDFERPLDDIRGLASQRGIGGNNTDPMSSISQFICGQNSLLQLDSSSDSSSSFSSGSSEDTPGSGSGSGSGPGSGRSPAATSGISSLFGMFTTPEANSSEICNSFTDTLNSNQYTKLIWGYFQPLLVGYITYYPNTTSINKVIKQANTTFDILGSTLRLSRDWLNVSRNVYVFLDTDPVINFLRNFTASCLCKIAEDNLRMRMPNGTSGLNMTFFGNSSICDSVHSYLNNGPNMTGYDWRNTLNFTNTFAEIVENFGQCLVFDKFKGYSSKKEFLKDSLSYSSKNLLWAALEFEDIDKQSPDLPSFVSYKIRMDSGRVDNTKRIMDRYWRPGPRKTPVTDTKYITFGFAYIQDMIDHALIKLQTGVSENIGVYLQQFPYPCYVNDRFIYAISRMLPLFFNLAWVLTVSMLCKSIVHEKEKRLKEVMKIMGLGNLVHWVAWFINAFIMMFITILLLTIIVKGGKVLQYSNPAILLLFFTMFGIATIMQCFLISVFFSKANIAACCAGFIYFILYLPYTFAVQWEDYMTTGHKVLACLSSSVAFGFGCSYIAQYEEGGDGIQFSNLGVSPMIDDDFNMGLCMLMMLIDSVIYGLFTWYIEAVFPGQYGIPRKWYFPIQKSYWFPGTAKRAGHSSFYKINQSMLELNGGSGNFEEEPKEHRLGVAIRNLKKIYKEGKKLAVDGLTINFYEGQITSFLGHNGAGKTTTMSVLTGLFPPTEGTAFIYGYDITANMDQVRNSLGMCPQHNVLFDHLTVEEHLWFYARMKGLSAERVKRETEQMIKDVGLPHKRNQVSSSLSGGMKRKLSVAMAFVGNAKTVILDEPTAGVDPYARRAIWDLLLKFKKGRTIILSTHHMDEADVLGDRIAIISHGKLRCCGSSLFLKSQYGNGYYLTLVRSNKDVDDDDEDIDSMFSKDNGLLNRSSTSLRKVKEAEVTDNDDEGFGEIKNDGSKSSDTDSDHLPTPPPEGATMLPGFSEQRIEAFLKKFVPGSRLSEDNTTELTFQLPDDAAHDGSFERLFKELERCHKELGISSFGISDTSLEEVFLKVAEDTGVDEPTDEFTRKKLEEVTDGGRFARSVTRLSHRRKKKKSFLKNLTQNRRGSSKVDSEDLITDSESVVSVPVSDVGDPNNVEEGFNHKQTKKVEGKMLILKQFYALFVKRFHHLRRSKKGFVCEIILPAVFILLAMIFAQVSPPVEEAPPLELHPWLYTPKRGDQHLYTFYSNDGPGTLLGDRSVQTLLSKPGQGNRCMKPDIYSINEYGCDKSVFESFLKWTDLPSLTGNLSIDSPECSCADGRQRCPSGAGGPEPAKSYLATTDYLYNMTSRNISDWLVKTMKGFQKRRYGGFSFGDVNFEATLNSSQIQDFIERLSRAANNGSAIPSFNNTDWYSLEILLENLATRNVSKVWYNNKGWASSVSYMNVMNNIILRTLLHKNKDPSEYGIKTINHPMPFTDDQLEDAIFRRSAVDVVIAICVIFAMSFIPASFTLVLIEERASTFKHLQFVSGVNPFIYWFSHFCWDMLNYMIPSILCIIIFACFQREAYIGATNGPCLVALLFLYGWASTPLMYPFSRLFSVPSTAMVVLQSANIFLGTTSTLATSILELLERDDEGLEKINNVLRQVFLLLPQYCLGRGLIDMSYNQLEADTLQSYASGSGEVTNPFEWDEVGRNLFSMFMLGIVFFIFNLLIEYNFCLKRGILCCFKLKANNSSLDDEDEDVSKERRKVLKGDNSSTTVLKLENLTKVYRLRGKVGRNTAVDRLCLGVPKGQCFGLLGVNGAGKTTTFKMLTGDVNVTNGNAVVNGYSILTDMVKVRQNIGYCPQFDAIDPLLTGREILTFYARLRGVPESELGEVAEWGIRKLGLLNYADRQCGSYSGGNKRKLNTAVSLIGNPSLIFLDEPTTGMDPRARRFLWNCINNIVKDGRSVILTSHSMEECEALCGRLAIMVNGQFKCIGSIQHLKNRFGDGYTVILRISGEYPDLQPVLHFMQNTFASSVLKERHHNMLEYQLGADAKLSYIFGEIEAVRRRLNIEDYSVSQTTLDQVFINFAKQQTDMLDDEIVQSDTDRETGLRTSAMVRGATTRETDTDEISVSGSTLELIARRQRDAPILSDEESLAGSTVGLIRPGSARSSTRSTDFPNVEIF